MKKTLFVLASCSLLLAACRNDEPAAPAPFTGITPLDASGNYMAAPDPTDWTRDAAWTALEKGLFTTEDAFTYASLGENIAVALMPAFPNPCRYNFNLQFTPQAATVVKIAVVNQRFTLLHYQEQQLQARQYTSLQIDVSDRERFKAGSLYRVYYAFYNQNREMSYFGHGDVQILE